MNQDLTSNRPSLTKKERKTKYKLDKKLHKTRTDQQRQTAPTSTTTRRWIWQSLKLKSFSL